MSKLVLARIVFGKLTPLRHIDMGDYTIYPHYRGREDNYYERKISIYYKIDTTIPFTKDRHGNIDNIDDSKTETFTIRITEHRK